MNADDRLTRYNKLLEKCDRFERKGKTMPYTSANGYMFSLINKAGELGIRFDKKVQEAYFDKYNTEQFMSHGAKMKGYIIIPDELIMKETDMLNLLNESFDYVMSLPPK